SRKIHIHSDGVQALGKIPIDLLDLGIDSASFSAHKFCGPRGVGILYNKNNRILPLSSGGGQEFFLRGGTENLPGISAMTIALEESLKDIKIHYTNAKICRNYLEETLSQANFTILSPSMESSSEFSPYIITVSAGNVPGEVFVRMMDKAGFCLSSGSACSNNAKGNNVGILRYMGFDEKTSLGTVRISLGYSTNMKEVKLLAAKMIEVKNNLSL
ncbi:MAG: aminotransferase class V-fold PLP-dependent enzyme, partial [Sphaerochaetaceae bacterium]|nr:aminotransferase class V-fold PLP-dependent enzyme [Sphaerochaetaceae bacterium]